MHVLVKSLAERRDCLLLIHLVGSHAVKEALARDPIPVVSWAWMIPYSGVVRHFDRMKSAGAVSMPHLREIA